MSDPKAAAAERSRRQPEDQRPVLRHANEQQTADPTRWAIEFTADATVTHADEDEDQP